MATRVRIEKFESALGWMQILCQRLLTHNQDTLFNPVLHDNILTLPIFSLIKATVIKIVTLNIYLKLVQAEVLYFQKLVSNVCTDICFPICFQFLTKIRAKSWQPVNYQWVSVNQKYFYQYLNKRNHHTMSIIHNTYSNIQATLLNFVDI